MYTECVLGENAETTVANPTKQQYLSYLFMNSIGMSEKVIHRKIQMLNSLWHSHDKILNMREWLGKMLSNYYISIHPRLVPGAIRLLLENPELQHILPADVLRRAAFSYSPAEFQIFLEELITIISNLAVGTKPSIKELINCRKDWYYTPVLCEIILNLEPTEATVDMLIKFEAYFKIEHDGWTLPDYAIKGGRSLKLLKRLVTLSGQHKSILWEVDREGNTLLHKFGKKVGLYQTTFRYLIEELGLDPFASNIRGHTPLFYSVQSNTSLSKFTK